MGAFLHKVKSGGFYVLLSQLGYFAAASTGDSILVSHTMSLRVDKVSI